LRLTEAERRHLAAGAAALGIELDASVVSRFGGYADLLDLWSPRTNLLSCGSARELVERHLLDSLAIAPLLSETGMIVDLGTGAGFPGIPLAIFRPDQRVVLVEVRRRKVSFLKEVRRTLQLRNVEILEQRAEILPAEYSRQAESVVSRAVWSDTSLIRVASGWMRPDGRLFWMRSEPLGEIAPDEIMVRNRTVHYRIGADRTRTVEVMGFRAKGEANCST
jgi:16S rRNA (guanine527-N7)-methyltransferase